MNLQQLNQTGQNVWSFIVTAIVSAFVTGLIWFGLELHNSIVKLKRRHDERDLYIPEAEPRRKISDRVAIFWGSKIHGEEWDPDL